MSENITLEKPNPKPKKFKINKKVDPSLVIKTEIDNYLTSIKSTSENIKYKRISLSPLRYPGGKSKAVGLRLETKIRV